jgi:hypothetical protein
VKFRRFAVTSRFKENLPSLVPTPVAVVRITTEVASGAVVSWASSPWKVPLKHPGAKPAQEVCAAAGAASAVVRIVAAIDT